MRRWLVTWILLGLAPLAGAQTVTIALQDQHAQQVVLWGSFNAWTKGEIMGEGPAGTWTATVTLPPGRYEYAFRIDGRWTYDHQRPSVADGLSARNNILWVPGYGP